jgi:hypothetical protein
MMTATRSAGSYEGAKSDIAVFLVLSFHCHDSRHIR